jgi:hypothetical protein
MDRESNHWPTFRATFILPHQYCLGSQREYFRFVRKGFCDIIILLTSNI